MSTTQKRQKRLNTTCSASLDSVRGFKSRIKWNDLIYIGCLFIAILVGSLPGSAQLGPITPISPTTPTTFTPLTSTTFTPTAPTTFTPLTSISNSCHIDDWTALKALYESTGGDNWKQQDGWEMITNSNSPPKSCTFNGLFGIQTNDSGRVTSIYMHSNNLLGILPDELGLLESVFSMNFVNNNLNGSIPGSLANINNLSALYLIHNNLTGSIPIFQNMNSLQIAHNKFSCGQINQFINSNNILANFGYSPQYFSHNHEPFIADENAVNDISYIMVAPSATNFKWKKNGFIFPQSTNVTYGDRVIHFNDIQPSNAGVYTYHIYNSCNLNLQLISDPIHIIYSGYDYYGQPIVYNQIMVEFDSPESTAFYEDEIMTPNAGMVIDQCNCNRELYLWQFPSSEATMAALTEIDTKNHIGSKDDHDEIDGGFNNVFTLSQPMPDPQVGYSIMQLQQSPSPIYQDEVKIFLLDTGIGFHNPNSPCTDDANQLYTNAPVDSCYNGNIAPGYGYMGENFIDDDYHDEHGHGNFGYNVMSNGIMNIDNIKIVPLKIFDQDGQGHLFDLTCALYHAIDQGADIVNISAGFRGQPSSILEKAINTAREQQVFVCTASGNDAESIDVLPQYPASYAGLYHYEFDAEGELTDSVRYSNVISIASISPQNTLSFHSNFGKNSVTLGCYGENLIGAGLNCKNVAGSGTSFSTFVVSSFLALEIAKNNERTVEEVWDGFDSQRLQWTPSLSSTTITGKRLNINISPQPLSPKLTNTENDIESRILHNSKEEASLIYKVPFEGKVYIGLYDANGRYIQPIYEGLANIGKQQLTLSKKALQQGIYIVNLKYWSNNGLENIKILKMPVLK